MNSTLSKGEEIKIPGPDHPITLSPAEGKVRITVAGRIVAGSIRALRLEESGYPPVYYLPRRDVIAHGSFTGTGRPATWIAANVVPFEDGLVVEPGMYFKTRPPEAESVLPMFGDTFPS